METDIGDHRHVTQTLGEGFAQAVAAKDQVRLRELLHPDVDFRGMTPRRVWDAPGVEGVLHAVEQWFEDGDEIVDVLTIEVDSFADRARVGYRFHVHNADGEHLVEQQAYLSELDGRIGWLRIMCSGYRPIQPPLEA
ncbi:hypothetical protein GCM10027026_09370 [Myroides odoratimimus subsp. xuanwuensis]